MTTSYEQSISLGPVAAYLPMAWLATRIGRRLKGSRQAGA